MILPNHPLLPTIFIQLAVAAASYWMVRRNRRGTIFIFVLALAVVSLTPLLVPVDRRLGRWLVTVLSILVMCKLYDLAHEIQRGRTPSILQFVARIPNALRVVWSRVPAESRLTRFANLRLLLGRAPIFAIAIIACVYVFGIDWGAYPFFWEHTAKALVFYGLFNFGCNTVAATWRLVGFSGMDPFAHPAAAPTPADFWRRWNRPAAVFLYEYVFRPTGGRRFPVRAMLATFFVSAVIHEYLFAMALGRALGFQFAYFMIQGCAAVATLHLRPTGWRAVAWTFLTFFFALVTSVLFFAAVNHVIPFYSRPLPGWIGAWDRWVSR